MCIISFDFVKIWRDKNWKSDYWKQAKTKENYPSNKK